MYMTPNFDSSSNLPTRSKIATIFKWFFLLGLLSLITIVFLGWYLNQPPSDFPTQKTITIMPGLSTKAIVAHLAEEKVVRSGGLLYFYLLTKYDPTQIKAGDRKFSKPLTTAQVSEQLTEVSPIINPVSYTHLSCRRRG